MIAVTTFKWVPEFAQGFVRDLRVRWALEEAGLPYEMRLIGLEDRETEAYRALQPFGQAPVYQEDDLILFESGAIVRHIAGKSETLAPRDPAGRARVDVWLFAALNSVEPAVAELAAIDIFHTEENWAKQRRPGAVEAVENRLAGLEKALGGKDYLEGRFTAGDILMTTVLRDLGHTDILSKFPALDAYRARCTARPAFKKAYDGQMAIFAEHPPRPRP